MNWLVDADVTEPDPQVEVVASGGTETVINDRGQLYRVHTFTNSGTLTVTTAGSVECLVVGGGGAGGQTVGTYSETLGVPDYVWICCTGGGGGGGVVSANLLLPSTGSYTITVGDGGQIDTTLDPDEAPSNTSALDGGDSIIAFGATDLLTAKGGGGGAINEFPVAFNIYNGRDGASSGGGYSRITYDASVPELAISTSTDAGSSIFGQGNDGADGTVIASGPGTLNEYAFALGGGGGGAFVSANLIALTVDTDPVALQPSGGRGVESSISGSVKVYGAGGGGTLGGVGTTNAFVFNAQGAGGISGGGNGARGLPASQPSQPGADGFGGGGGCGYTVATDIDSFGVGSVQASNGGSGVVIIRYPIEG